MPGHRILRSARIGGLKGISAAKNLAASLGAQAAYRRSRVGASRRVKLEVKRAIVRNEEMKYVDFSYASGVANNTAVAIALTHCAVIAQGASSSQRIGVKASFKGMQLRGVMRGNDNTFSFKGAIIIIYDRSPGAGVPLPTDVLMSQNALALNNRTNKERFKIVYRKDYDICGQAIAGAGNSTFIPATYSSSQSIDEYIKLKGLPTEFGLAGTGAMGDVRKGALYLLVVGSGAAGGANSGELTLNMRTHYKEN